MRKSILMSLVCGSLLAILSSGIAAEPIDAPVPAAPANVGEGQATLESLEAVAKKLGYTTKLNEGRTELQIVVPRGNSQFVLQVSLSPNKAVVWVNNYLWQVASVEESPAPAWGRLMVEHKKMGRAKYHYFPQTKALFLATSWENRVLTSAELRQMLDGYVDLLVQQRSKVFEGDFRPLAKKTEAQDKADREDLNRLQGTWKAVTCEKDGQVGEASDEWVISGEEIEARGARTIHGRIRMTGTGTHKQLDQYDDGGYGYGIYKIEGDTLTLIVAPKERPADFTTKGHPDRVKFVFKKGKPD